MTSPLNEISNISVMSKAIMATEDVKKFGFKPFNALATYSNNLGIFDYRNVFRKLFALHIFRRPSAFSVIPRS